MKIVELSEEKFNSLVLLEPDASYKQTSYWGNYSSDFDYKPLYIGYADDVNGYVALAMILLKAGKGLFAKKTAFCPAGYLINYYDAKLFEDFTNDLKKYLSKKGVSEISITPNVKYITARGDNDYLIKSMKELGYEKIDDNFYFTTNINRIKKAKVSDGVRLKTYVVEKKLRKVFQDNDRYRSLYENMLSNAKFIVCELDAENTICGLNEEINDAKVFIDAHSEDLENIRKVESKKRLIGEKKELSNLVEKCIRENGDNPVLAVTCLIQYNGNITQLFVDSKDGYESFGAVEALNEKTLRYIKDLGYKSYDSYAPSSCAEKVDLIGQFTFRDK